MCVCVYLVLCILLFIVIYFSCNGLPIKFPLTCQNEILDDLKAVMSKAYASAFKALRRGEILLCRLSHWERRQIHPSGLRRPDRPFCGGLGRRLRWRNEVFGRSQSQVTMTRPDPPVVRDEANEAKRRQLCFFFCFFWFFLKRRADGIV